MLLLERRVGYPNQSDNLTGKQSGAIFLTAHLLLTIASTQ